MEMTNLRIELESLARDVFPAGLVFNVNLAEGEAADEIARAAGNGEVDVVVMATHGRQGWKRWVFGSVAEKVIRTSSKPVLVVKEPIEEAKA